MDLDHRESKLLFEIMGDLSADFEHAEVRLRMGRRLLDLLRADHFASYVWDDTSKRFVDGVYINMDPANLQQYEAHFQFRDPIPRSCTNAIAPRRSVRSWSIAVCRRRSSSTTS